MKRFVLLLAGIFVSSCVYGENREINMLFIGNSFTFYQEMPGLVKKIAEEGNPGLTVNVQKCVYGGQNLFKHWEYYFSRSVVEESTLTEEMINDRIQKMENYLTLKQAPEIWDQYYNDVVKKLSPQKKQPEDFSGIHGNINRAVRKHKELLESNLRRKWDYVVLQSWVDVVDDPDQGYAKYAQKFAEVAEKQGAKVILYVTAPFIQNKKPVTEPQLQDRVDRELKAIKALENKIKPYGVVHMPLAVNMIQQGGTDLTFCYVDNFHPNQTSTFLTVNMFYSVLFKKSPVGLQFDRVAHVGKKPTDPDGGEKLKVFDEETKKYLQEMAYKAVVDFEKGDY